MISTSEIAPSIYRIDSGRGRVWTANLSSATLLIETESGARIRVDSDLGSKILRLIALRHPRAPYLSTV